MSENDNQCPDSTTSEAEATAQPAAPVTPTQDTDTITNILDPQAVTDGLLKDPKFLASLQAKMASMLGCSSGYLESLPDSVKARVRALRKYQLEYFQLEAEFMRKICTLENEYRSKFDEVFQRRSAVVLGVMEPSDEDKEFGADETEELEAIPEEGKGGNMETESGTISEGVKELSIGDEKGAEASKEEDTRGIPNFWLTVLQNVDMLETNIFTHDIAILASLQDIKMIYPNHDGLDFTIEFYFADNEYFTDKVLTKQYNVKCEVDPEEPFGFTGPEIVNCKGCEIHWNKGKNVTRRHIRRRTKDKKVASPKYVTRVEPQDSFFMFFTPPVVKDFLEDMSDDSRNELEADFTLGEIIKEKVISRAVLYFTGEIDQVESDQEESVESGEGEGEYNSDNDPDFVPGRTPDKPPECQNQTQ
ncbi:Nucleosome assembly protein 1-like 1 isoform X1 [Oopsacas minuta]|uniref:Nucleosome assembly protein 1-like 1 isoform X1 n=1 Tax=Oopsacas minuta TaxID=111878 RepID=A0AAV7KA97_9METZ|nr:Nucleosome assembly protein 1-like 1 isoform X1 [Oopsacas minuta]